MRPLSYICRCLTGGPSCKSCSPSDDVGSASPAADAGSPTGKASCPSTTSASLLSSSLILGAANNNNKSSSRLQKSTSEANNNNNSSSPVQQDADADDNNASSASAVLMLGRHHQAFAECVSRSTGGPLSLAESQLPVFHSLSTQLKEVQAMIHKLELQVLDQDRILKERAELACKQEHHLEAKVRELESKQDSTQAIGEAARALESVTGKMQTRLAEVQQMRQDLAQAEDHMRQLKSENQQMKACIECMKTKMLEVEECGAKTAQGWKKECDQLKADVCSLRSAAEDLCAQLHKANQKCTKLESVHSRLRDTCIDTSSSSPSMSDNEHGNRKEETAAGAISESLAATSSRKAAQIENLVAPDVTKRINRKRKYKMDFDQLAKKLTTTNSRSTAERHHDWPFGWESEL